MIKNHAVLFIVIGLQWLSFSASLSAETLTLSCPQGTHTFKVELPQTPQEFLKGLMFREQLAEDEGMLFLYNKPRAVAMWMKNTLLSLDMIFGDAEGKILAIYENTTPYSLKMIGPIEGTTQVLEIIGGSVHKKRITKECLLTLHR